MGMLGKSPIAEKFNNILLLAGGCYAIRRSIWEKRKPNEKVTGGEDMEYSLFLHMLGYDILYNPKAKVLHEHTISRNQPTWWSCFANIGISEWQFILYKEILKLWCERFFIHKFDNLILSREW